jgi:hypothetical protein
MPGYSAAKRIKPSRRFGNGRTQVKINLTYRVAVPGDESGILKVFAAAFQFLFSEI